MMRKFSLTFLFLLVTLQAFAIEKLKINIVSTFNGYGLTQDIELLTEELRKIGHEVSYFDLWDLTPRPKVDINLYIQLANEQQFQFADQNYFIPNPEFCFHPPKVMARFDKILCRTKEVERIFSPINPHCEYISFTSRDCLDESVSRNYKHFLHLAGGSEQKGTETVARTWLANPHFPLLFLIRSKGNGCYPPGENFKLIYDYLPAEKLNAVRNECAIHVCTSETEGFGHYIFEGMSCGNIIVTTNAPPMNEFIHDPRCLVEVQRQEPWQYATRYFPDGKSLDRVIEHLLTLPEEELRAIGKRNREFFIENDRFFRQRVAEVFTK